MRNGRRSASKQKREISSYRGRGGGAAALWLGAAGVCLVLAGLCCFVLPGMRFSGGLLASAGVGCVLFLLLKRWAELSRVGKTCKAIFLVCLCVFLLFFAATEAAICRAGRRTAQPEGTGAPDVVIVLGAGVNGKTPSLALQNRIDTAAAYLKGNLEGLAAVPKDVPVILCGGQGRGEDITEARCMYDALVKAGVAESRLHLEEESATTAENLLNAKAMLRELGLDAKQVRAACVTGEYHVFRAEQMAADAGLTMFGVPSEMPWWWLRANYYTREFFAVWKWRALSLVK